MGYVVSAAIFGITVRGIDNYAHGGGFLSGYAAGRWLDPLKPERADHMIYAAVCLLLFSAAMRRRLDGHRAVAIIVRWFGASPGIVF